MIANDDTMAQVTEEPARPYRFKLGSRFAGRYDIEALLGEGGMGAVYVVLQRSTGRQRALKTMLPSTLADASLRARFEREATVSSRIQSDHVVEVLAAGVDAPTGLPWLTMELLQGSDLGAVLKQRGALPPREAEVFCLVAFEQMAQPEVARHLNISVGAVAKALCKARQSLSRTLSAANSRNNS